MLFGHNYFLNSAIHNSRRSNHTNSARRSSLEGWWGQKVGYRRDLRKPRLTLGEMFEKWCSKTYKNRPEQGPGGSVWAQTWSKWRPGPQDHFGQVPGPKNPIQKYKIQVFPQGRRHGAEPPKFWDWFGARVALQGLITEVWISSALHKTNPI